MNSATSHKIKHRETPNDEFMTPSELAKKLLALVPVEADDSVLDSAPGEGAFTVDKASPDFFLWNEPVDWIVTNPPYSKVDAYLEHSCEVAKKGFAYLLAFHALTPKRIEACEKAGFYIKRIHLCKVFRWYGISAFVVWGKGGPGLLEYDRVVWR